MPSLDLGGPIGPGSLVAPEYQPVSFRAGSFTITPFVTSSLGYDDNVFATRDGRRDDLVWRTEPAVVAESDWSRHQVRAEAAVEGVKYATYDQLDAVNARVGVLGRIDVALQTAITFNASYLRQTDTAGAGFAADTAAPDTVGMGTTQFQPVTENIVSTGARFDTALDRIELGAGTVWTHASYENRARSGVGDQAFRDGDIVHLSGRAGYRVSAPVLLYSEVTGNIRRYAQGSLNSEGVKVVVGLRAGIGRLIQGEMYVGVLHQTYDAAGISPTTTPAFGLTLGYTPTPRLVLSLRAARDIGEPSATGQVASVSTTVGMQADYSLHRNLIVSATGRYTDTEYRTGSGSDRITSVSIGPTYYINRTLQATATYRHTLRAAGLAAYDYARNQVSVGLHGQF